jgi:hypothetical protein
VLSLRDGAPDDAAQGLPARPILPAAGDGISRHFLPSKRDDIKDAYITWFYPLGVITFSHNLLFIGQFNPTGAVETSYRSETNRRADMAKPSKEYDKWMDTDIAYWRFVETGRGASGESADGVQERGAGAGEAA